VAATLARRGTTMNDGEYVALVALRLRVIRLRVARHRASFASRLQPHQRGGCIDIQDGLENG
jgi:hypothetical protein